MMYCAHCMNQIKTTYKMCPFCGKSIHAEVPPHHLLPGTILNGKILVGTALGEGGFGITYIGLDLNLDLKVAIKEYYPNGYVNRSNTVSADITYSISEEGKDFFVKGKERFLREARILARFSSEPGVVEVRDFFEQNNTAYIIMEYLEGQDLKQYLKENGRMSPEEVVELLMPVMKTLTKIHAQGLIHRDISPDNIRMSQNGTKLLDFGAARDVSAATNKSLSVMLKPGYAPEEQYRSKGDQGPWTDVYALCATMYTCITGTTPDDATQRLFNDELKSPSALGISIDLNIEYTLMRGMAVLKKDRFASMEELIDSFNGKGVDRNYSASAQTVERINDTQYTSPYHPTISPTAPPPVKKGSSGAVVVIALMAVALLAIIGSIVFILLNNDSDGSAREKVNNKTSEVTTAPSESEPTVTIDFDEAENVAAGYIESYYEPDFEELNGYCMVQIQDILKYEAKEAGKSLSDYLNDDYGVSSVDVLCQYVDESDYAEYSGTYGDDYTCEVEIVETVQYDSDQLEELIDMAVEYYEGEYPGSDFIEEELIETACDVDLKYTLSGSILTETEEEIVTVALVDGEWLVFN